MRIKTSRGYDQVKVTTKPDADGNIKEWFFRRPGKEAPDTTTRLVTTTSYDRNGQLHGEFDDYNEAGTQRIKMTHHHGVADGVALDFHYAVTPEKTVLTSVCGAKYYLGSWIRNVESVKMKDGIAVGIDPILER